LAPMAEIELQDIVNPIIKRSIFKYKFFIIKFLLT
jgi:hypothetical protein